MLSKTEAAYKILKDIGKPLHASEIVEIALKRRLIQTSGKTPQSTMAADLLKENQRRSSRGEKTRFKKVGKGTWIAI